MKAYGTGSGSSSVAGFVISGGEISDCVTRKLVSMFDMFIFFHSRKLKKKVKIKFYCNSRKYVSFFKNY